MNELVGTPNSTTPKLALNRNEAAEALGLSPATIDRLTQRGLLRPSRATRRPMYSVAELQRFLKETTQADYQFSGAGFPTSRRRRANRSVRPRPCPILFPGATPPAPGENNPPAGNPKQERQANNDRNIPSA